MTVFERTYCSETLLDLLLYEMETGRLSVESEEMLREHLSQCSSCASRVLEFHAVLEGTATYQNFG